MIMEQEICNLRETLDIKNDVIVNLDSRIQKLEKSDSPYLHVCVYAADYYIIINYSRYMFNLIIQSMA